MAKTRMTFDVDVDVLRSSINNGAKFQRLGSSLAITFAVGAASKWDKDTLDAFGIRLKNAVILRKPEKKNGLQQV